MPPVPVDREFLRVRFTTSMRRIGGITTFLHSGAGDLKQPGFGRRDGVRADIMRAVIVFLHAAIEDFVRGTIPRSDKKFTLYSVSDIKSALRRLSIKPASFEDLFPPLTQMAKRRKQIVHHGDLQAGKGQEPSPWELADEWQLIHWHLAVSAFYYRVRRATGPTSLVEDRAGQNVERAIIQNIQFARALSAFPSLPPDQRLEGLEQLSESLTDMLETLKLEVGMFLDADGKPLDGSV